MNNDSLPRRCLSAALSAALLSSSWGPAAYSASAQQAAGKVSAVSAVPRLGAVPASLGAGLSSPPALPLSAPSSLTSSLPAPTIDASIPNPDPAVPSALEAVEPSAPGEAFGRAAAEDFSRRATGEALADGGESVVEPSAAGEPAEVRSALPPARRAQRAKAAPAVHWRAATDEAVAASRTGLSAGETVLAVAAVSAALLTGALFLYAAAVPAVFVAAMWRGRAVDDARLASVLRDMVLDKRYGLDANAAALVRPYRPDNRYKDFTFAFASRGLIWVRPELAATPWLLRLVLIHELKHMELGAPRGPPRGAVRGLWSALVAEARAHAALLRGPGALKQLKVSGLQRALTQTRMSMRLGRPYDVLVLNPDVEELADPALYDSLSGGSARVTLLKDGAPAQTLSKGRGRFRAIVLGGAARALPNPKSKEHLRLQAVLKQLDSLYVLATRLVVRGDAFEGTTRIGAWTDLVDRARRLRENGSRRARQAFEAEVGKLWRQIVSQRLKGVGISGLMNGLYGGLRDRGFAFLSFAPGERGVASWERLLRYWESADGGQFRVTRVDLEDGGHLLILRKVEARVGLWLRPTSGGRITISVPNASLTEEGRAAARKSLEEAGFGRQLRLFEKMEVVVRHVFGADAGRQEIYVTVPRRYESVIRKYAGAGSEILDSRSDFETHLMDSADLQGVKPVWRVGITGAAGSIFWIDTGADSTHADFGGRLDVVDMVDEGGEDWIGHGTHVAGISVSGNEGFLGMAKGATGAMAKVFSRDQAGASDGNIMAAAVVAMNKIFDVISLSLGSRGSSADNLAEHFSQLTHRKNAAGEFPIVTASAGNAGPFDGTLSQPAAGVDVIAVAAAAKSKDDGAPEIAFYSSVGPDVDRRYAIKRYRFKPDITGIGGDVTTAPGSSNVYKDGVYSAKSKDASRGPSDLEDGKHTGMSGTSMSNPAVAGIALLVKLAMRSAGAVTPFVAGNMAFAVKSVLMRTAKDMGAPPWFQGAGLADAWAAVSLVAESGTRALGALWRRMTGAARAPVSDAWGWLERLKAVQDAEDRAFSVAELSKNEFRSRQEDEVPDEPSEEPFDRAAAGNAAQAEVVRRFNAARDAETPALLEALKDPIWLVRMRAAAVLLNFRAPASAAALAESGLGDPDPRVRRMALLALAETPARSVDAALRGAAAEGAWDVGVYAAYALARRGDRSALARVVQELANADKRARFTSAWLLGQIGSQATAVEAEGLSARARDRGERGNVRHLAAAALFNLADAAPEAISDRVVMDLLDAAGPENLALTRTIAKIFPVAVKSRAMVVRMRAEPLKPVITDFVLRNRGAINKPGALRELVQLLAQVADVPLDAPTAPLDPVGVGVAGVDAAMGPMDLLVFPPRGAEDHGLDAAELALYETTLKASLPMSRALWLAVPEHKIHALTIALQHRGWTVRRSLPYYPLSNVPAEAGGLAIDLSEGEPSGEIAADADLSLVRVRAAAGVSEARVAAALERVAAAARGRGPVVIALTLGSPAADGGTLSELIGRLVAAGVGVVVGAGNAGPGPGTVTAPGDSGLAVVVAAASRAGLQFYSSRGTPGAPRLSWSDLVDDLRPGEPVVLAAAAAADAAAVPPKLLGTAAAAERTAAKLAALARVLSSGMAASGRSLPEGWFLYLAALVKRTATALPGYFAHEVGAGLFDSLERAVDALRGRLSDPEALVREAKALSDESRKPAVPPAASAR
ncbi:MAG: S8 family serine peptidase [Elusimicrobia bacterium]|nr:S8 family serine peptidase [Elusimicrobiota bacterium]